MTANLGGGSPASAGGSRNESQEVIDLLERARAAALSLGAQQRTSSAPAARATSRTAPELTGRTGHRVDHRTELYALGATFYEWATHRPAFDESDPLRLLRDQLASTPVRPDTLQPGLPPAFSDIVLRLLEKDPESRYQSVQGLLHDLDRLVHAVRTGGPADFAVGQGDFPERLAAPVLVGRQRELDLLQSAIDSASHGGFRLVLVSGAAGAGKTEMLQAARAMAAAKDGLVAAGKFEQYARVESAALVQALGGLGSALLARDDEQLAAVRARLRAALGSHAALLADIREIGLLLGDCTWGQPSDAAQAMDQAAAAMASLLGAVAREASPLVLLLDDLQWSGSLAKRLLDTALAQKDTLRGVVIVGAAREESGVTGFTFPAARKDWAVHGDCIVEIRLGNLDAGDTAALVGGMLRCPAGDVGELAGIVSAHASGNPFDTVELVNALRKERLLQWRESGWQWSAQALRAHLGGATVVDLLQARIARLPARARALLERLACIQGDAPLELACRAAGLEPERLEPLLQTLVAEGLVERLARGASVRMRHDRMQQAVFERLGAQQAGALHLELARKLAPHAPWRAAAARQYLAAWEQVSTPEEALGAARLLYDAAAQARKTAGFEASGRMLDAALALLDKASGAGMADEPLRLACEIDLHLSLCNSADLHAADRIYARLEQRGLDPLAMADVTCAQVDNLVAQLRLQEAVALGLRLLAALGLEVPQHFVLAEMARRLAGLKAWVESFDLEADCRRPEAGHAAATVARLIYRLALPSVAIGIETTCWLVLEAWELWKSQGPSATLASVLACGGLAASAIRDRRTPYLCGRHMLALCDAKGWAFESSQGRCTFAFASMPWFEPLEEAMRQARLAREGLAAAGDGIGVSFTHRITADFTFECNPTLESFETELEACAAMARRAANVYDLAHTAVGAQMLKCLRASSGNGAFDADGFTEAGFLSAHAGAPDTHVLLHIGGVIAAGIFEDVPRMLRSIEACAAFRNSGGAYVTALVRWLGVTAGAAFPGIDRSVEWLAARAADAPANFRHMLLHAQAEQAWARGDTALAAAAFEEALTAAERVGRPWHRALITTRAARFHLSQHRGTLGRALMAEAERQYRDWGALAKAQLLRTELGLSHMHTTSQEAAPDARDGIDTLALLRAAQALGSERTTAQLQRRVRDVLMSIAGASHAVMAIRDAATGKWSVPDDASQPQGMAIDALLPLAALRLAERTREPLLAADATSDERLARDPYFSGVARCSLLVVPVLHQGDVRGMLFLENRVSRSAFSRAHLNAVHVIAGQLAVSIENAQLNERLERKVQEQTGQLEEAQSRLLAEARRAGMAQVATNVLHNVGNVLTSVNVSTHALTHQVHASRITRVADLAGLLKENASALGAFMEEDERGRLVPAYIEQLAQALKEERDELLSELARLSSSVEHIKNVVSVQQGYAGSSRLVEISRLPQLVDDALQLQQDALRGLEVTVERDFESTPATPLDRVRLMQILLNLVENALHALEGVQHERRLHVRVWQEGGSLRLCMRDNGSGIDAEHLPRIFSHGFTTKPRGHGFGLHSCAIAAREMGGTLEVASEGPGRGASFTLALPLENAAPR